MMLGVLLVVPLGALVPGMGDSGRDEAPAGPQWTLSAQGPNPISTTAPSAEDILANLTTGRSDTTQTPQGDIAPSTSSSGKTSGSTGDSASAPTATDEVGSESAEPAAPSKPKTVQIPGTAPNPTLAEQLKKAQSRFTPSQPTQPTQPETPAASPGDGPLPVATPSIAAYPAVPGASHLFPVAGGATFSNDWGTPRPGGRSHQGIDLFAPTGTPIVAISDGTLFKVGWNGVGGWRFWLRDKWGNEFYHAHLSAFAPAAKEGAVVKAGTVIGFVGNTGDARTTPPHLHFEVHPGGGAPIPPFSYVSLWPRV